MLTARKLRDLVVTNWPIKLTALVLATVLWAAVSAEAPSERLVPVTVVVELPEGRTFKEPLPTVEALYAGSARDLIQLLATPPIIRKRVPDTLSGSAYTIELSTNDLLALDNVDVTAQEVRPRRLPVQLDDLLLRRVRVIPRITLEPDSGYGQLGPLTVMPESVRVRGPEALVREVTDVTTVQSVRRGLKAPVRIAVAVDTTGFGIMTVTPTAVEVRAEIVPVVERLLMGVPVTDRDRTNAWEYSPPVVVVTISGPGDLVAGVTRDSVRVLASPGGTGSPEAVQLEVTAPAGIRAWANPNTVSVRKRG